MNERISFRSFIPQAGYLKVNLNQMSRLDKGYPKTNVPCLCGYCGGAVDSVTHGFYTVA